MIAQSGIGSLLIVKNSCILYVTYSLENSVCRDFHFFETSMWRDVVLTSLFEHYASHFLFPIGAGSLLNIMEKFSIGFALDCMAC